MPPRHDPGQLAIDIADETYVGAPPSVLAPVVADPAYWRVWWPGLDLQVTRDRGRKGQQWRVAGALRGSMEIWLEPVGEGTVVHWFLRAEAVEERSRRGLRRERERWALAWKAHVFALKDRLEAVKNGGTAADKP